ncbi:hypothetical protein Tco_1375875 [Tanacetum coccineum]
MLVIEGKPTPSPYVKRKPVGAVELKEIQYEDTLPSENTSKIHAKVEGFEPPQEEIALVRRFVRTHRAPEHFFLNVEVEEHTLRDLNEHANYKAALLDSESNKWLNAMNAEMQSMKDNQVYCLVDLPPNGKIVGSKWILKKETNMDGNDDNSKHGNILMQERLNLNKTQGALTPEEVKHMQNVPYALVVGSIIYAVRYTRPDVAFAKT